MSASVFNVAHEEGWTERRREPDHTDSVTLYSADWPADRGSDSGPAGGAVAGFDGAIRPLHANDAGPGDATGRRLLHVAIVRATRVEAACQEPGRVVRLRPDGSRRHAREMP